MLTQILDFLGSGLAAKSILKNREYRGQIKGRGTRKRVFWRFLQLKNEQKILKFENRIIVLSHYRSKFWIFGNGDPGSPGVPGPDPRKPKIFCQTQRGVRENAIFGGWPQQMFWNGDPRISVGRIPELAKPRILDKYQWEGTRKRDSSWFLKVENEPKILKLENRIIMIFSQQIFWNGRTRVPGGLQGSWDSTLKNRGVWVGHSGPLTPGHNCLFY